MTNSIQPINVKQYPSFKRLQKPILEPADNPSATKSSHSINPLDLESSFQNKFCFQTTTCWNSLKSETKGGFTKVLSHGGLYLSQDVVS